MTSGASAGSCPATILGSSRSSSAPWHPARWKRGTTSAHSAAGLFRPRHTSIAASAAPPASASPPPMVFGQAEQQTLSARLLLWTKATLALMSQQHHHNKDPASRSHRQYATRLAMQHSQQDLI